MWNVDYMRFLVRDVWKIDNPVTVLDCGCGYGALGLLLMPLLPSGSRYIGVDFNEQKRSGRLLQTTEWYCKIFEREQGKSSSDEGYRNFDFLRVETELKNLYRRMEAGNERITGKGKGI